MDLNHRSQIKIYFDGACPVCNNIVLKRELNEKGFLITLINARTLTTDELNSFFQQSIDLNKGMLVYFNQQHYYGHEALLLLLSLSEHSNPTIKQFETLYVKLNQPWLYRVLVKARLFILMLLRKKQIIQKN